MRKCGDCQLCCKLMPISEINKPALSKCPHQRFGVGCSIYNRAPKSCRTWSCQWLVGGDGAETLRRPDRAHYVVDILPDFITTQPHDGSPGRRVPVVQVWLDPAHPTAWRDAALFKFLEARSHNGFAALIRSGSGKSFVLIPPVMNSENAWQAVESELAVEPEHSAADIDAALHECGIKFEIHTEAS